MPTGPWHTLVDANLMAAVETIYQEDFYYTPVGGTRQGPLPGMYEKAGELVDTSGDIEIRTTAPMLRVRLSRFTALGIVPADEDIVEVDGGRFEVIDRNPDGHAEITLILMRAP